MQCIVVDDETLSRKLLQSYIDQIPQLHLVALCKTPMEAAVVLAKHPIDLMFLDIQMPQITGISFLKSLSQKPLVVFTTAYEKYAIEGYSLDVVDDLLKPFWFDRFFQAVQRVLARHATVPTLPTPPQPTKDYLIVKSEHRIYRVRFQDIMYIQSMQAYVVFYTHAERIFSLNTMKSLMDELPDRQFIRIHKSYIVATSQVAVIEGNQVIVNGQKLPIGASYREAVFAALLA